MKTQPSKSLLRSIARRAMLQRGLLADFSPAVASEIACIAQAAVETGPSIRDLRELLWASIDNDDSRDLDQLSVAEPLEGGAVKILVAIADVDGTVRAGSRDRRPRAHEHDVGLHGRRDLPDAAREALDRPHLPGRGARTAWPSSSEMVVGADGAVRESDVYRAVVRNRAKLAYDGVAAWLEGEATPPRRVSAVPGLEEQLRVQDRAAQAMKAVRHQHGALSLETIEARAVFDGDVISDLRPDEKNRAKVLIEDFMIAANGVVAKYLEAKGFPSLRRVLRSPERWDRIVALAAGLGERLPPAASAPALEAFLDRRRRADPARFPDLSLSIVKLLGAGEYVLELPGQRTRGTSGWP